MYYVLNFVLPTYAITTLTICGLFSPFNNRGDRQEKAIIGLTSMLTIEFLLLLVQEDMPKLQLMPLLGNRKVFRILIHKFP